MSRPEPYGPPRPKLVLHPVSIKEAERFVARLHRRRPGEAGKRFFAVGVSIEGEDEPRGVAIVGPPTARMLEDGWTAEVVRCCTDGTVNACSMLYRAAWRAARALGYTCLLTYTEPDEGGGSLRTAGFRVVGQTKEHKSGWDRPGRPRVSAQPEQAKIRWAVGGGR